MNRISSRQVNIFDHIRSLASALPPPQFNCGEDYWEMKWEVVGRGNNPFAAVLSVRLCAMTTNEKVFGTAETPQVSLLLCAEAITPENREEVALLQNGHRAICAGTVWVGAEGKEKG